MNRKYDITLAKVQRPLSFRKSPLETTRSPHRDRMERWDSAKKDFQFLRFFPETPPSTLHSRALAGNEKSASLIIQRRFGLAFQPAQSDELFFINLMSGDIPQSNKVLHYNFFHFPAFRGGFYTRGGTRMEWPTAPGRDHGLVCGNRGGVNAKPRRRRRRQQRAPTALGCKKI